MLLNKLNLDKFILGLILFTLPISLKLNSISLIIGALFFINKNLKNNDLRNINFFWVSIVFFGVQFISFLSSFNILKAEKKFILYLPFLLLPLIFSYFKNSKKIDFSIFNYLFYGTLTILFYGILRFFYDVFFLNEEYNYGKAIHLLLKYVPHHVYLSIFIIISILFVSEEYLHKKKINFKIFIIPILYLFLILLTSRMAMLIAIFVVPLYLFKRLKKVIGAKTWVTIFLIFLSTLFIGFNNQFAKDKMVFAYKELLGISNSEKTFYGISQRKQVWSVVCNNILESPFFGYGIGDVQDSLNDTYKQINLQNLSDLNAHNQFFQFFLNYGSFGFFLLSFCLYKITIDSIRIKNYFSLFCLVILFLFFLTESILERHWGVVIFSFVINYSVLINLEEKKDV